MGDLFSLNKDDSWQVKCHLLSIFYLFIYFYRGNKKIITHHLCKQNEGQPLPFLVARKLHRLKLLKCFTENFVNIRPCSCLMEKKSCPNLACSTSWCRLFIYWYHDTDMFPCASTTAYNTAVFIFITKLTKLLHIHVCFYLQKYFHLCVHNLIKAHIGD